MAGIKVVARPASEPVTLEEVKTQLRIDEDDLTYDGQLNGLVLAAREWCEGYQNRAYITQTLELALDRWPCGAAIDLPRPPLQSVSSVEYGEAQTWDAAEYIVDDFSLVSRIVPKRSWPPGTLPAVNGIRVTYIAGYGDASAVPQRVKQAILLLVTHWFENGMCPPPPAVLSLLDLDRVVPV